MDENKWSLLWRKPMDRCSVLDACGSFSSCNSNNKLACKCLPGFRPKVQAHWDNREFSSGCTRNSTCNENDIFLKLKKMKVSNTDSRIDDINETECEKNCLQNCQCVAYSYTQNENSERTAPSTCWIWTEELKYLQEDYDGGHNISVRLARSDLESTVRTCKACGTNIIPYPLSTGSNCGDPAYFNFHCSNYSTGKLSFNVPEAGSYNVTSINPTARRFVIQAKETDTYCDARSGDVLQLNQSLSSHFKLINVTCSRDTDAGSLSSDIKFQGIDEIEISWDPPQEPSCISSSDCKDWPHSTCNVRDGPKRCLCNANFRWDGSALNCTPEAGSNHKQFGEEGSPRKNAPLLLILGVTIACIIVFSCVTALIFICKRRMVKRKERKENIERNATVLYGTEKRVKGLIDSEDFKEEDKKRIDIPFFDLDSIIAATDNFSAANKLGRGGFGPVYKGTFPGGQEIAVKRLSSVSGQGLEEFKNEVVLIARLQHRNLVRLLGYCIHGNEKILLYEYMPNKSLDFFIFDPKLSLLLNWEIRFNIILGVARGLLYLHQDSRLRIIHRDLKTSNILLDAEMNPKISDFGLARIFEGKQTEGSTERVMGTYGYMSPEYALDGLFSVKSDAFSYGVVVLEILSGRRSTRAFKLEKELNLLTTAWRLWRADYALDFLDETISQSVNRNEFIKCPHFALLCVQEDPADRPNMSNVVVMPSSEVATFPIPRQPAFVERKGLSDTASSSSKQEINMSWSVESGGSR
ncbi:G-type lectin S-receptor-like serine/threonine-protein kinase At4g03230 isoform X2 [Jatropha curcas]|uniref:G-type lectin S-receptor-like serine/threonine-protein kinase At4g03230 isoform X2 n=1 Tax=Jatropha curcas TaxID=180498 RepID=UPI001894A66E|nr:G-type lectin S-receptor-like serine/threonine-protein kinase At4g03230 isoform X2 [Jatropha curcas]